MTEFLDWLHAWVKWAMKLLMLTHLALLAFTVLVIALDLLIEMTQPVLIL